MVQYSERMGGIVSLWAAILQSSPLEPPQALAPQPSGVKKETLAQVPDWFRPSAGWRWLILITRPPLVSLEPTPLLLLEFLEIASQSLFDAFGHQFVKLVACLFDEGIRGDKPLAGHKSRASLVRLELWLEEWDKSGRGRRVKPLEGRECDE